MLFVNYRIAQVKEGLFYWHPEYDAPGALAQAFSGQLGDFPKKYQERNEAHSPNIIVEYSNLDWNVITGKQVGSSYLGHSFISQITNS
jgi:hypothetical protein